MMRPKQVALFARECQHTRLVVVARRRPSASSATQIGASAGDDDDHHDEHRHDHHHDKTNNGHLTWPPIARRDGNILLPMRPRRAGRVIENQFR